MKIAENILVLNLDLNYTAKSLFTNKRNVLQNLKRNDDHLWYLLTTRQRLQDQKHNCLTIKNIKIPATERRLPKSSNVSVLLSIQDVEGHITRRYNLLHNGGDIFSHHYCYR